MANANASCSILRRSCFFAAAIIATLACSNSDGDYDDHEDLVQSVISCEEAFARLEGCCRGFEAWRPESRCVDRAHQETTHGCDGYDSQSKGHETPALSLAESRCIRALSCDDIVKQGICERARTAPSRYVGSDRYEEPHHPAVEETVTITHPPVCP